LSYIDSSSDFDGATLVAAKELSTKKVIAATFRIFTPTHIKPSSAAKDEPNFSGNYKLQSARKMSRIRALEIRARNR
jgi:hypothetical protein